ncbi:MAG: hypothetical protein ACTHKD_00840 [Devosia sp.]|jgi:hypothetical protein
MTPRFSSVLAATLALVVAAAPAFAVDNNPNGTTITKSDLEGQGYSCSLVSTGFWECTKDGSTTYWCDAGSCQPKPLISGGGKKGKFGNILNNGNLTVQGTFDGGSSKPRGPSLGTSKLHLK